MELPKNITQIGEVSRDCKIYMEDYVLSYLKQLNQNAQDKDMAVALYGRREEEGGITYYFLYGACRLEFLQREVRHLSQAQLQEIEKFRKKYFLDLEFCGYRVLNGEMIEGVHLCEQGICRYIGGYARFYEKNDAMLVYMLDVRDTVEPEQVDRTKYEEVQKRQEERRAVTGRFQRTDDVSRERASGEEGELPISRSTSPSANLQKMRMAAVGAFALLCLLGIATFREDELRKVQFDGGDVVAASGSAEQGVEFAVQKDTIRMEDKLEQALLEENQGTDTIENVPETESCPEETPVETLTEEFPAEASSQELDTVLTTEVTQTSQNAVEVAAYVVQPGDTLIAICIRQYGNDVRVTEVCTLNEITDPDDIKEGQVILLPR